MDWNNYWNNYKINIVNISVNYYKLKLGYKKIFITMFKMLDKIPYTALEIGSGKGIISSYFQKKIKNNYVLDIEFSPLKEITFTKKKIVGDLLKLPFKENKKFDFIHSCGVLEHFSNKSEIINNLLDYTNNVIFAIPAYSIWWKIIWAFRVDKRTRIEYNKTLLNADDLRKQYADKMYEIVALKKNKFLLFFPYWVVKCKKRGIK